MSNILHPGFDSIEYAIFHNGYPNEPHRVFTKESDAIEWINEWIEMGGLPVFTIKWRGIGFWTDSE